MEMPARTNARGADKFFPVDCALLYFYRHNLSDSGQSCQNPEHFSKLGGNWTAEPLDLPDEDKPADNKQSAQTIEATIPVEPSRPLRVEPPKTPLSFEQCQAVISDNFPATSGNLRQRWESIGKANEHAGSFGKWPEEYE